MRKLARHVFFLLGLGFVRILGHLEEVENSSVGFCKCFNLLRIGGSTAIGPLNYSQLQTIAS
jgi:hypothetical protein